MLFESMDELDKEVTANFDARTAGAENDLRWGFAGAFENAKRRKVLSIKQLAKEAGVSVAQVSRVLQRDIGGSLSLRTITRCADVLGLTVHVTVGPRNQP